MSVFFKRFHTINLCGFKVEENGIVVINLGVDNGLCDSGSRFRAWIVCGGVAIRNDLLPVKIQIFADKFM